MDEYEIDQQTPYAWKATSCVSWLWPYSVDGPHFEARRAIANVTHGLRHLYPDPIYAEADLVDVFRFIQAANAVQAGAALSLADLVAEAIARGATWRQVGACLKISKTAAHNRFGKGLNDSRMTLLSERKTISRGLHAFWTGRIPKEAIPDYEEFDWEVTPPDVAVDFACRDLVRIDGLLHELLTVSDGDDDSRKDHVEQLKRVYDLLQRSQRILLAPQALEVIADAARETISRQPWVDENAETYFIYVMHRVTFAINHLTRAIMSVGQGDIKHHFRELHLARFELGDAARTLARADCIQVLAILEERIVRSGHAVHIEGEAKPNDMEIFRAYWKDDREKLAQLTGVEAFSEDEDREEFFQKFDLIELDDA